MVAIKGFIKNSLIEWEGKIVSIVFLSKCNLRCQYCHSPHLVNNPCELETIPVDVVLDNISKNMGWIDGVVISGGEPTLSKGLYKFIKAFCDLGVKVKLDTNGTNPEVLEDLIENSMVDYIAMDIKAPLENDRYETVANVKCDIEKIKKSIKLIMNRGIEYEFRTTVCPKFLDKSDVEEIAMSIMDADKYILQSFRPNICLNKDLHDVNPYSEELLNEMADVAGKYVKKCWVRGKQKELVNRKW